MKKRLLIVLSLILAALLLVVACDDQANNLGSGDSVVIPSLPEGAPSVSKDDLTEITKEPEKASENDMLLLDTVLGELQSFALVESAEGPDLSEEAKAIVLDFIDAFGKKGIELKGEGYALSFSADIEEMKFTVSGSFNNFKFGVVTLNGTVNSTIIPNPDYDPYDEESVPYTVDTVTDSTVITVSGTKCSGLGDAINTMMEVLKKADPKSMQAAANEAIPGFIKTINDFIGNYSVSSDMLTVALNGKITDGGLVIGEDGIDLGKGLSVDHNSTAYTNKPLEYNGSKYKFFVYESGTIKIVNNPNDKGPSDKEPPVLINVDETLNVILETSEKIGNQKIRLQAKISGEMMKGSPEVDVLLDINGKVIDLEALVSAE